MEADRRGPGRGVLTIVVALAASIASAGAEPARLVPHVLATGIVINVPQHTLFVVRDDVLEAHYQVGLGQRGWPTFVGAFTIAVKEVDPTWDVPVSIQEELRQAGKTVVTRVPPGPANPLGKYWLGLSMVGYGIHGTNAPQSVSKFQSHGCIRMLAADIEDLFGRVEVGTPGLSVYEPILVDLVEGRLWLEAHRDVYRRDSRDPLAFVAAEAARLAPDLKLDIEAVQRTLRERDGRPHPIDVDTVEPERNADWCEP